MENVPWSIQKYIKTELTWQLNHKVINLMFHRMISLVGIVYPYKLYCNACIYLSKVSQKILLHICPSKNEVEKLLLVVNCFLDFIFHSSSEQIYSRQFYIWTTRVEKNVYHTPHRRQFLVRYWAWQKLG